MDLAMIASTQFQNLKNDSSDLVVERENLPLQMGVGSQVTT